MWGGPEERSTEGRGLKFLRRHQQPKDTPPALNPEKGGRGGGRLCGGAFGYVDPLKGTETGADCKTGLLKEEMNYEGVGNGRPSTREVGGVQRRRKDFSPGTNGGGMNAPRATCVNKTEKKKKQTKERGGIESQQKKKRIIKKDSREKNGKVGVFSVQRVERKQRRWGEGVK